MPETWKAACWKAEQELAEYRDVIVPAMMERLRELEQGKPAWIPVNERKPEEFVSVLIYAPGMAPLPTVHEAYLARECWVKPGMMILQGHEVTHWMEMPVGPGKK